MQNTKTYRLTLAGLLIAVGLILPFATSHAFGVPGTILLPMHLPVLLIGLLCGPGFGLLCGLLIPVLSSLFTGMPPLFPMLPIMVGELATYGFIAGAARTRLKWPVLPSLFSAMLCGRVTYGLIVSALLTANGGALRAASVGTAVIQGLPGIAVQIALIPLAVKLIERGRNPSRGASEKAPEPIPEKTSTADPWASMLVDGVISCIVVQNGKIAHTAEGRGVRPIMNLLKTAPELLSGAHVVDKIIGKAAALLLVFGGAKSVYGELMSRAAYDFLTLRGIPASYGRCVDMISNRDGTGICPLERSVMDVDDPQAAVAILQETIRKLMGA